MTTPCNGTEQGNIVIGKKPILDMQRGRGKQSGQIRTLPFSPCPLSRRHAPFRLYNPPVAEGKPLPLPPLTLRDAYGGS